MAEKKQVQWTPEEEKVEVFQKKIDVIEEKLAEEYREIERKYAAERDSLLRERNEAIKSIPDFWKKVFERHPITEFFSEVDFEILESLVYLEVQELYQVVDGYKLILGFKDGNKYFTNKEITKSFQWNKEKEKYDVEATKIQWTEGNDLSDDNKKLEAEEEQENGAEEEDDLVFHWFGSWEDQEEDEVFESIREDIWSQPGKIFRTPSLLE